MIGAKVRFFREKKGISQAKLAELAGLSKEHIYKTEKNAYPNGVSLKTITRIASALGVSINSILGGK